MDIRRKVIIDTDIGDDIDDAFALLLAMNLDLDIIGVTTVFKNTEQRARMAKKILTDFEKGYENVPVYAGHGTPLEEKAREYDRLYQFSEDLYDEKYAPISTDPDDAVSFIIESCIKYGRDLTVIALGPFTNIAKVIERDPEILSNIGRFIIMGGAFFSQYVDWNVMCDPLAAKVMFDNVKDIHAIGADVTHKLELDTKDDAAIDKFKNKKDVRGYITRLYGLWKMYTDKTAAVLHDPLAVYYAYNPDVCTMQSAPISVVTDGPARGLTLNIIGYNKIRMNPYYKSLPNVHTVAKAVERDLIIKEFMKCFK